jgi:hypothetical protein
MTKNTIYIGPMFERFTYKLTWEELVRLYQLTLDQPLSKQKPAGERLFSDLSNQTDLVSQIRAAEVVKPTEPDEFDRAFDAALDKTFGKKEEALEELKTLACQHWEEWLPEKVKEWKADGRLDEELGAAASLAQTEIEHSMKQGYPDWAAREVALPLFILLPPEVDADGLDEEHSECLEHQPADPQLSRGRKLQLDKIACDDPQVDEKEKCVDPSGDRGWVGRVTKARGKPVAAETPQNFR